MTTTPTIGAADLPEALRRSTAADGKTELFNFPGCPLMVRAVDFNRLHAESEMRRTALLDEMQKAALAAGRATAAQPGVVYAELPVPNYPKSGGFPGTFAEAQMHAFADATHTLRASHGQAPASVLHLVHSAFAEIAMAFPKAFALHKVGIADTAVREALAAPATAQADSVQEDAGRIEKWSDRIQRVHPKSEPEFWPDALRVKYMADEISDSRAARAPADSVQEDAALWRWLAEYLVGTRTDLDDEIVASETVNDLRKLVKAAIKQGEKQ